MTSIQSGIPINAANVRPIDLSKVKMFDIAEAPEGQYQRYLKNAEHMLKIAHSQAPELSSNPTYKDYASVQVNGKVVATVNNQGFVQTSNALGSNLLEEGLPGQVNGQKGPVLAQARAEFIAELLGGKVIRSPTAMTQSQFNAVPEPSRTVDNRTMREDPVFETLQKTKEARTLFLVQQIAQTSVTAKS